MRKANVTAYKISIYDLLSKQWQCPTRAGHCLKEYIAWDRLPPFLKLFHGRRNKWLHFHNQQRILQQRKYISFIVLISFFRRVLLPLIACPVTGRLCLLVAIPGLKMAPKISMMTFIKTHRKPPDWQCFLNDLMGRDAISTRHIERPVEPA
jgi:hypothetical protein